MLKKKPYIYILISAFNKERQGRTVVKVPKWECTHLLQIATADFPLLVASGCLSWMLKTSLLEISDRNEDIYKTDTLPRCVMKVRQTDLLRLSRIWKKKFYYIKDIFIRSKFSLYFVAWQFSFLFFDSHLTDICFLD